MYEYAIDFGPVKCTPCEIASRNIAAYKGLRLYVFNCSVGIGLSIYNRSYRAAVDVSLAGDDVCFEQSLWTSVLGLVFVELLYIDPHVDEEGGGYKK